MKKCLIGVAVVGAIAITAGCRLGFDCKDVILQEAPSPDGAHVATVFSRDCGATTSMTVHVYLGAKGEKIGNAGNIFRGAGTGSASVKWRGDKVLEISTDADTFLLMKEYSGITFELHKPEYANGHPRIQDKAKAENP